jgi:hypothetical protein
MSQAVLWWGYPAMQKPAADKNAIRELKAKRNLLFNQYCKSPQNTRLAIEIRLIDDQIADLTQLDRQATKAKSCQVEEDQRDESELR